ncbi:RagB/SusD family nutrient uptake outer membrane protein [Desertivirga xinjiangensis]|uniref:RagB/SusD family nutrient uptake outer membrane protein n=1 Tax=Desertivirga xinjiangensis TaxID=539206 RepID=UPI00210905FB|nr:RagB/SusD family nutrient uptake outer membrane protein [Pedobacter xinjiangensis]
MKLFYKYLSIIALLFSTVSCKKYLDITPDNLGTLEYAFRNRNEAENYLFTCYAYLQRLSDITANPAFTTSGEIIYPDNLTSYSDNTTGFFMLKGTQTASNPGLNTWDGANGSYSLFRSIRACNTMLENIDQPIDLSATEKKRWIAEVKFLKAYYHYYLMRMYGPIPIVDENLPITSTTEEVRVKRAPLNEVVQYIVSLLDEAAPDLPPVIQNQSTELGRVTKLIALAVKAEVLATAASPLFNGNADYVDLKDKDGVALFPITYDPQKWKAAADACLIAINECAAQGLTLHQFIPPANISQLSDSLKTVLSIQTAVTEKWELNDELIWAHAPLFGWEGRATPRLTSRSVNNAFSNPGTFSVPIQMQELFYTDKGVPINEDLTWDYNNRYTLKTGDRQSRYFIREGYETVKAHFGREPRFYADVAFDGGIWFGNGIYDQNNAYAVQARGSSSYAGPHDLIRFNNTGYWPKKLVNYLSVYDDGFQPVYYHLPIMRLASLYLLYAEALNEFEGPQNQDIFEYIDLVRARAGLPGVKPAWSTYSKNPNKPNTKEGLRQIIHQERRIELCFEAQAGWDLRRWKELQTVLSNPLLGWSVYNEEAINYYRPTVKLTPVFSLKDYLWPIRTEDIITNPNLVQNPYW